MTQKIRIAVPEDASGMLKIYAPYINNTSLTFETEVPSIENFAERIKKYLVTWPWIVVEQDDVIVGYAYASQYRERTGYQWSVESSIYISEEFKREGVGKALYKTLFIILKNLGYRNVYAVINLPNEASVHFHEKCGFRYFATYDQVGYKLGQWKDVGWWRYILNEFVDDPIPPMLFSDLDKKFLSGLLI